MGSTDDLYAPCPNCRTHTWAIVKDPKHTELDLLHCNECGFEVDMRVVQRERWIMSRIGANDRADGESA